MRAHRFPRSIVRIASAFLFACVALLASRSAHAQRDLLTPLGGRGTMAIDQLAGFRAGTVGGFGYAGPIGFNTQSLSQDINGVTGQPNGSNTYHFTSFWIAPSADIFVIDHLSLGGVIEFASTSRSVTQVVGNTSTDTTLPTLTNITFLPRIGWMFAINDRFGIWPRVGLGYASRSGSSLNPNDNGATTSTTYSAFVFDADVGFLYRINENWFIKGTPEISFAPGSWSTTVGNVSVSVGGSAFQFAVNGGVGVMFDLF